MKRQVNSPMGSPYVTQTLRAKTKRVVGAAAPVPSGSARKRPGIPAPRPRDTEAGAAAAGASSRRSMEERWSQEMDESLREAVLRHGADWTRVVSQLRDYNVSAADCSQRWAVIQDVAVKGPWAAEEDDLLRRLVEQHGSKKWSQIALEFPGRSGKQCRERWLNHLDTRVKKSLWSEEEDQVLCEAQRRLGNKWSEISKLLPGRAENAVKNRFNSLMTRRATGGGGPRRGGGGGGGSSDGAYPASSRKGSSGRSGGNGAGKGRASSPPAFIAAVLEGNKLAAGPHAAKDGAAGERSRIWAALEAQRGGRPLPLPAEAAPGELAGEAAAGGGGSGPPPRAVRRRRRRYSEEFDDVDDTEEEEDEYLSDDVMDDDSDDYGAARRRRAAAAAASRSAAAAAAAAAASSNSASRGSSAATDGTSRSGARSAALLRRGPGGAPGAAAPASGPATLDTNSSTSTSPPAAGRTAGSGSGGGGGGGGMRGGKGVRYMTAAAAGGGAATGAAAAVEEEEEILRVGENLASVEIAAWWQAGLQPSEEDLARALDGASAANGYTTFADGRHRYADASPLGPAFASPAGDAALFSSGDWRSVPMPPAHSFLNSNSGRGGHGDGASSVFPPPPPQPPSSAASATRPPLVPAGTFLSAPPLDDNIIPTPLDISTQAGDIAFDVLAGVGSAGSSATRTGAYDGFTGGLRSLDLPHLSPTPLGSNTLGGGVGTGGIASSSQRLGASLGASGSASAHRGARAMHERAAAGAAAAGAAAAAAAAASSVHAGGRTAGRAAPAPPAAAAASAGGGGGGGSRQWQMGQLQQVAQLEVALGSLDLNKSMYWANTAMSNGSAMGPGRQAFDAYPSVKAGGAAPPSIVVRPLGDPSTFGPGSAYYGSYSGGGAGGGPHSYGWTGVGGAGGGGGGGPASNGWGGGSSSAAMMMSPGGGMMSPLANQLSAISRESDPATRAARRAQMIEQYMMNGN